MNETLVRSLSGAVFGALVIGLVYYSPWTNALLWAFVSIMAVREFKMGRSVRRSPRSGALQRSWRCGCAS